MHRVRRAAVALRRGPWKHSACPVSREDHLAPAPWLYALCGGVAAFELHRNMRQNWPARCENRRIAIYGGAFDPITNAHLTVCSEIVHSGEADEVWIVPCGSRPDKPNLKTPAVERYCMCQIAVNTSYSSSFPVKVSNIDIGGVKALFTYDLLCELSRQNPEVDFVFVIGSDWLQPHFDLKEWRSVNKNWKEGDPISEKYLRTGTKMLQEFDFLVLKRPGYEVTPTVDDPTGLKKFGPRMKWMSMPDKMTFIEGNLSSTEIRKRAAISWRVEEAVTSHDLSSIDGLVPPGVYGYIYRSGLYS